MTADMRRFHYALDPLRVQRQWQLDAAVARLGRVRAALTAASAERDTARAVHLAQQRRAIAAREGRVDPARQARELDWLRHRAAQLALLDERWKQLLEREHAALGECRAAQIQLDAVARHRKAAAFDHARFTLSREATEADRDWLERRAAARKAGKR